MRNKKIWTAGLTAVFLTMAGVFAASAAEGWVQENGQWCYYQNGSKVYATWAKSAAGDWYYLDADGYMATDSRVDNGSYFVDANGKMCVNTWINLQSTGTWYRVSANGKIITDGWAKIGDYYYYFDYDGVMQTGWVDNYQYYCDPSSGMMLTGWQKLYVPDEFGEAMEFTDGSAYFYFGTNGKRVASDSTDEIVTKRIDGKIYGFNENGIMQTGWKKVENTTPEIKGYRYFMSEDKNGLTYGQAVTGTWFATVPPEELDSFSGDVQWYYFNNTGVPTYGNEPSSDDGAYTIKSIGGKRYCFNEEGVAVYGLIEIDGEYYYFGNSKSDCYARTGVQSVEEGDGTKSMFYFQSNGAGYTGVKDSYLYYKGKRQCAEIGTKYAVYDVEGIAYVVDQSGKVRKSIKTKDADGNRIVSDASGHPTDETEADTLTPLQPVATEMI